MLGNDLFAARLELARAFRPGIVRLDKRPAGVAERATARGIAEQPDYGVRKIVGGIGGEEVASRLEREPLGADTGRHDGLDHRERLENLDARATARAERYHVYGPFGNGRPHVVQRSRDDDARS